MLKRTRLSLIYPALYLSVTGLGFLLVPQLALRLFFSNGVYESTFIRISGAFLIVLGVFVIQVIRYRLDVLYRTIIAVRFFLLVVWLYLYFANDDPIFLAFFVVVGLGVILSIAALLKDTKNRRI